MTKKTRANLKINPSTSTTFADTQLLPAEQFIHLADSMATIDDDLGAAVSTLTTTTKTVVGAINELDTDMGLQGGGTRASATVLRAWAAAESLRASSITRNDNGVVTAATVTWPDGSAGTLTTTHGYPAGSTTPDTTAAGWVAPQIITITHADSSQTVTITTTRDINAQTTAATIVVA